MKVIQVQLNLKSRHITITYKLSEDVHIKTEATEILIDIEYIALLCRMTEQWRALYHVKTKQTHITFDRFREIIEEDLKAGVKWQEEFKLFQQYLQMIEEDTTRRHLNIQTLPLQIEELVITDQNKQLMDQITSFQELVPLEKKTWTLLYVVKTQLYQEIDGEKVQIIKLGITKKEIEEYKNDLFRNYEEKIKFSALFAKRLYCPPKESLDIRYFHNKMVKNLPQAKIYLRASNQSFRTEFYYMTKEWVQTFHEYLALLIDTHKDKYVEEEVNDDQDLTDKEDNTQKISKIKQSLVDQNKDNQLEQKIVVGEQQQSIIISNKPQKDDKQDILQDNYPKQEIRQQNHQPQQSQVNRLKISADGLDRVKNIIQKNNIQSKLQQRMLIHAQIRIEASA